MFLIKRNCSSILPRVHKLNLYKSMVLPILLYGSSVWYANIGNSKALESIQRKATKWILFDNDLSYYQRLISVSMLPISLYMEVNDVLLLFKIINGKYDFKWDDYVTFLTGRHKLFDVKHVNYEKSRHNFRYRTCRLANILHTSVNVLDFNGLKKRLLKYYWNFFMNNYNELNSCSWRILCLCAICRQLTF